MPKTVKIRQSGEISPNPVTLIFCKTEIASLRDYFKQNFWNHETQQNETKRNFVSMNFKDKFRLLSSTVN